MKSGTAKSKGRSAADRGKPRATAEAKLVQLRERRRILLQKLDELNQQISLLERRSRPAPPAPARRARRFLNDRPLIQYIIQALQENPKGLSLRELQENILAAGYRTASTNFAQTLYQSIYNHHKTVYHDPAFGVYRLRALARKESSHAESPAGHR